MPFEEQWRFEGRGRRGQVFDIEGVSAALCGFVEDVAVAVRADLKEFAEVEVVGHGGPPHLLSGGRGENIRGVERIFGLELASGWRYTEIGLEQMHTGVLFEIGPDGYGYILDHTEPGKSYAFHAGMLKDLPVGVRASSLTKLEGSRVTFTVAKRRVATVSLAAAVGRKLAASAK